MARSYNHCCSGKAVTITYSKRVFVTLVICTTCNAHAPYCNLWPVKFYKILSHYLINGTILEKVIEHLMCVLTLCTKFSWQFSILRRTERSMIIMVYWYNVKNPLLFPDFHKTWIFSTAFLKIFRYEISWKFVRFDRELFHWGGKTDRSGEGNSRLS
jgi:hypothetical protein